MIAPGRGEVAAQHGDARRRSAGASSRGGSPRGPRCRASNRGSSTSGRPVTVSAAGSSRSRTSRSTARQAAGAVEVVHQEPAGRLRGRPAAARRRRSRSKSSRLSSTPRRPAIASRCTTALVEPPIAASATIALRNDPRAEDRARPALLLDHLDRRAARSRGHVRAGGVSGAGVPADPGQRHARAPRRAGPSSRRCPSCCSGPCCGSSMTPTRGSRPDRASPARTSSLSRQTSVPQPSAAPRKRAGEHRPAGHDDGRQVDGRGGHQQRRDGLVAARRAARRRRSGWRAASPRSPSRPCCATASRSAGPGSRRGDTTGRLSGMPPASQTPCLTLCGDLVQVHVARRQVGGGVGDRDVRAGPSNACSGRPRRIHARWM